MKRLQTPEWIKDSLKWRGVVLTGKYAHWCDDWDGLPIDETCPEWPCVCRKELEQARGTVPKIPATPLEVPGKSDAIRRAAAEGIIPQAIEYRRDHDHLGSGAAFDPDCPKWQETKD